VDPVTQIILVDDFFQPLGLRIQIASRHAAISWETFGQDQPVAGLQGKIVVIQRQPAADIAEGILLCAHSHVVGIGEHVAHDVFDRAILLTCLAFLDEPGVLGKAATARILARLSSALWICSE